MEGLVNLLVNGGLILLAAVGVVLAIRRAHRLGKED